MNSIQEKNTLCYIIAGKPQGPEYYLFSCSINTLSSLHAETTEASHSTHVFDSPIKPDNYNLNSNTSALTTPSQTPEPVLPAYGELMTYAPCTLEPPCRPRCCRACSIFLPWELKVET